MSNKIFLLKRKDKLICILKILTKVIIINIKGLFVSSLVRQSTRDFTVGHAVLKADSNKMAKHEKIYSDNQHTFIPFAFNTFGFLAS